MAKITFEDAMKGLEEIVRDLETGDLPLEIALKKFEEGIQLSKLCSKKLDETEKKITILLGDQKGGLSESAFGADTDLEQDEDKA